ncbi:hypothetical protein TNCV_4416501 [Trichonephila clavipes]|uniref:Uncharacterized protein n=1 Tax=Trichonephila clavipes TaxID=2585209 RepID=A0A8X6VFX3_TRICX|nr:hypothetical protein TNCV_4416501 [Trichonephila clavipes]
MAVMDRTATAQQIQSVTHHSVSAFTIQRRLQQSVLCFVYPRLETTGVCVDGHEQRNGKKLYLLTHTTSACNITMLGVEFGVTVFVPIENVWSMLAQRLAQDTPPAATPDQLWQYCKDTSKASLILC